jgi:pilus assembly protein Flp/PilA
MPSGSQFAPAGMQTGREKFMRQCVSMLSRFLRDEDGPTAVEYAVMLALNIVVCVAAITTVGTNTSKSFGNSSLNTAVGS